MTYKEITKKYINNDNIFSKLEKYVFLIEEENKKINLTGFTGDKLWEEGIYESIIALDKSLPKSGGKLLDIGAGAGFPSVPYIIANPNKILTIYEPIGKRVHFLETVKEKLGLNIDIQKIRIEESKENEKFDFICARAVANLKILIEISHHVAKMNCEFAFIKGKKAQEEVEEAKEIMDIFKMKLSVNTIVINDKKTNVIKYSKKRKTPFGYPRKWSIVKADKY